MIHVSWYGAVAYCDWRSMQYGCPRAYDHSTWLCNGGDPYRAAGFRLPTDAEWEYAAQYNDERIYPWGNRLPNYSRANYSDNVGWTSVVGSYPAAPADLDLYDMAGNVWEWCNDWEACDLGTVAATDPTGPDTSMYRILRGGSWHLFASELRCAYRFHYNPSSTSHYIGFRCARTQ